MHRLFVALELPSDVRATLLDIMGGIPGARWQSDEQLHLTVRFIGEVDRHQAQDVAAALGGVAHPGFSVSLDGLGHFDHRGRIDALWAGARPHAPLKALHNKVDRALAATGLQPEARTYLPHVTLARFGRLSGDPRPFVEAHGGFATPPFAVDGFALFESHLTREGSVYSVVDRYRLS